MLPSRPWASLALGALAATAIVSLLAPLAEAQEQMPMAMPSVAIEEPATGSKIAGSSLDVTVKPSNFKLECSDVGKPGTSPMQGHVHAMIDGMDMPHLANMYCTEHFAISTEGLKPGKHVLAVVLANDAHQMDSAPAIATFEYAPAVVAGLPRPATAVKASIVIISPKNGETVDRKFNLKLAVQGFHDSCDLEGRPNIAGYGHLHVFATQDGVTNKTPESPLLAMMKTEPGKMMVEKMAKGTGMSMDQLKAEASMAMVGLLGMPCTSTIPVDLTTWRSGPARITIMLANDDHMPTPGIVPTAVSITLK